MTNQKMIDAAIAANQKIESVEVHKFEYFDSGYAFGAKMALREFIDALQTDRIEPFELIAELALTLADDIEV